jgi:hypothetical protein
MVDEGTWNRLDDEARIEFHRLRPSLQAALERHGVQDGFEFQKEWSVTLRSDSQWCISSGTVSLEGIVSKSRQAIEALFTDVVQNLNR